MNITIDCQARTVTGHWLNQIKKQGLVPGVIVEAHKDSILIQMAFHMINNLAKKLVKDQEVELNLDGKTFKVLIKDVDYHPVKGDVRHVDFFIPTKNNLII